MLFCVVSYGVQVLDIAETGDAGEIDMLVRDIYGGDCKCHVHTYTCTHTYMYTYIIYLIFIIHVVDCQLIFFE